jgi:transposase, IS30 family
MESHYKQLTQVERYQIQALHGLGESARSISNTLKRSNKTISRELLRLKGQSYQAELAQCHATVKRHKAKKFSTCTQSNQDVINQQLSLGLSPEQIAGRMRHEGIKQAPSCSSVYRWVSRLGWRSRLPRKGKPRRRPNEGGAGLKHIPNRVDIDQRPAIVDANTEMGHWEGDTVHGQDAYFVTLVERVTKTLLVAKVPNKGKKAVGRAIIKLLKHVGSLCKTITFDNGGEFADHQRIAKKLKCKIFFAKPYQSWQRGLNENTNGLIRRFFPKKTCFANITNKQIEDMQFLINNRPRKSLQFKTPMEVLANRSVSLIVNI